MHKHIIAAIVLACVPLGSALANGLVRDILSSGITTATTYMTFHDSKLIVAAREEAGSFVASDGRIRGPYLEAMLRQLRSEQPQLIASDMELASAILASQPSRQ